jgi:hypothetical protein
VSKSGELFFRAWPNLSKIWNKIFLLFFEIQILSQFARKKNPDTDIVMTMFVFQEKMENGSLHNFCFSNREQVLLSKSSCYILWRRTCLVKFLSQVFHSLCQFALTRCYLKERKKALTDVWKRTKLCHDFVFIIVQWGKVHKVWCILSWWDWQCESIWMLFTDLIKSKWVFGVAVDLCDCSLNKKFLQLVAVFLILRRRSIRHDFC